MIPMLSYLPLKEILEQKCGYSVYVQKGYQCDRPSASIGMGTAAAAITGMTAMTSPMWMWIWVLVPA